MNAHFYFLFPLVISLSACSIFKHNNDVKDGHFRVANYLVDTSNSTVAYVYTMCDEQRPVSWVANREYPSGHQRLWVKAVFHQTETPDYPLEAYVNFDMNFPDGVNYQLMYTVSDDAISIWLQDSHSAEQTSAVKTTQLKQQNIDDSHIRAEQCLSGSV